MDRSDFIHDGKSPLSDLGSGPALYLWNRKLADDAKAHQVYNFRSGEWAEMEEVAAVLVTGDRILVRVTAHVAGAGS